MFSIIVCSHRAERGALIARHYAELFRDRIHEFILIDDAKSLCEGYTRGLAQSKGDLLIFSHDDIEFVLPNVAVTLEQHLSRYDAVGIGGTTKLIDGAWVTAGDPFTHCLVIYPDPGDTTMHTVKICGAAPLNIGNIQALDGCFIACRRVLAEKVGFDVKTFDGFHLYDLDFTFRAYLMGFNLAVCRDLPLIHTSQGNPDEEWNKYKLRFEAKHRSHLAIGQPATMRGAQVKLPKEKLAAHMQNGMNVTMVDRLTESTTATTHGV